VLPVMLLAGAVLVDIAVAARMPGWLAALPVTAGVALAAFAQDFFSVIPPWNWAALPVIAVGFAVLWGAVDRLAASSAFARWAAPVDPAPVAQDDTPVPAGDGGASSR
jgi:hypothetical protein